MVDFQGFGAVVSYTSGFEGSRFFKKNRYLCGDDGEKDTPVSIPNTAVKLLSAEDSEGFPFVKAGRCRADIIPQ